MPKQKIWICIASPFFSRYYSVKACLNANQSLILFARLRSLMFLHPDGRNFIIVPRSIHPSISRSYWKVHLICPFKWHPYLHHYPLKFQECLLCSHNTSYRSITCKRSIFFYSYAFRPKKYYPMIRYWKFTRNMPIYFQIKTVKRNSISTLSQCQN